MLNLAPINSYDPPTQVLQTRADIGSRRPRDGDAQSANNDLKCLKRRLSKGFQRKDKQQEPTVTAGVSKYPVWGLMPHIRDRIFVAVTFYMM